MVGMVVSFILFLIVGIPLILTGVVSGILPAVLLGAGLGAIGSFLGIVLEEW